MHKHYIENKPKHATVCLITDHPTVTSKLAQKGAKIARVMTAYNSNETYANNFVGVAKCHEADEFDMTKGRHIASSRADLAYHKAMAKDLAKIKETLMNEIRIIVSLEEHEAKMVAKTEAFIEVLKK